MPDSKELKALHAEVEKALAARERGEGGAFANSKYRWQVTVEAQGVFVRLPTGQAGFPPKEE